MPAKIKQGKYVDSDGVQQNVVFIGAEKAIFDDDGTRLDNKLADMSKASGLTAEDAEGLLGTLDANVNFQALVDAIANKVMNELVTNSALTAQLANYVTKAMMSNEQVNDNDHVPTSSLVYNMNEDITQLNSDKIPYVNYRATAGTNIDDAIKAGLDSTNQQTACILRVYIPSTAVYVLSVGYNSGIYSAYGIQVADPSNKLQLVYYSSDDNYKRSTISPA